MLEKEDGIIAKRKSLIKEITKLKKAYSTRDKAQKKLAVAEINQKQMELAQVRDEFIDEQIKNRR